MPSRPFNGNRYQVETRAGSPQYSATPPRSPMKFLPTAPESNARVASTQKYIKTSISKSPQPSPRLRQKSAEQSLLSEKTESPLHNSNSTQVVPARSPEPSRSSQTQEIPLSDKISLRLKDVRKPKPSSSINGPEAGRLTAIPETARRVRSPEPGYSPTSPEVGSFAQDRAQELGSPYGNTERPDTFSKRDNHYSEQRKVSEGSTQSLNHLIASQLPAQNAAQGDSQSKPPIPERAPSRRRSLTEKTRELLRKKPSLARDNDGKSPSIGSLPIQGPSEQTLTEMPASPTRVTMIRRTSLRSANDNSVADYSSPTSPVNPNTQTFVRENGHMNGKKGEPVPDQNPYGNFSLEPLRPLSPLATPAEALKSTERGQPLERIMKSTNKPASIIKHKALPDDSEGNVNTNHPLLQTARHTRFARGANGDLPLRHYHSQATFAHSNPDLTRRQSDDMIPPKRSSSLLYDPNRRFMPSSEPNASNASANDQNTKEHPSINFISRAHTAPAESELGIHPAHRLAEPPSTVASPAPPSTNSSITEHGATPPPIATARSPLSNKATPRAKSPLMTPPARLAPFPPSQKQKPKVVTEEPIKEHDWQPMHKASTSVDSSEGTPASQDPKYKTTATTNTPFYLNPASQSALIDFLKSTPPPSPPHPGTKVEVPSLSPSPSHSATGAFFNRSFITNPFPKEGDSSPPPPAPGTRSLTHLGQESADDKGEQNGRKGWKRMFSSGKSIRKVNGPKPVNGSTKKSKKTEMSENIFNGPGTTNGTGENGFMGMGKDGVWISRKNFLKT